MFQHSPNDRRLWTVPKGMWSYTSHRDERGPLLPHSSVSHDEFTVPWSDIIYTVNYTINKKTGSYVQIMSKLFVTALWKTANKSKIWKWLNIYRVIIYFL